MNEPRGRILVVDDSPTALKMARLPLESAGYEVITKKEAVLVSSTILREKPHIVLLDVNMPAIRGDKLVEIIRSHPSSADTILLLYSQKPAEELGALARRCGADGFVQKSADSGLLVEQMNWWMGRIEGHAEGGTEEAHKIHRHRHAGGAS